MPAPLQSTLTAEEDRTLSELRVAQTVPQRTRDRAHMLRLSAQGWTVSAIAEIFDCHEHTVRSTIQRWQTGDSADSGKQRDEERSANGKTRICSIWSSV